MQPAGLSPITAAANLRRSVLISCALAVAAIAGTSAIGHPLMGIFGAVGLGLGAVNNWMLQRSVVAYGMTVDTTKKKFRRGVMGRLGAVTVIALAIAVIDHPDGLGAVVGMAVFHAVMLIGAAVPTFRSLRPTT